MKEMKNVVSATTANGSKSNNNNNNVENTNSQMAKMESVENGEVKAEDVEVKADDVEARSKKWVELKSGSMYYAWRHNSCDTQRLVLVTFVEEKRDGKRIIDYVMIEPDKYIGENEKHEPLYTYKLHKYHKSSKWTSGADSSEFGEYIDGPNGVCVYPRELTIDDVKLHTIFGHGCLRLDKEMYDEFSEWLDFCNFGLKFIKYNEKRAEEKEAAKANADGNEDMTAVMTAYVIESGDDNNDTQNAIDYFTNKMNDAQEEADVALTRKMICLRGNGLANDIERLKELDNDYSAALGRYYMYKKYVEILSKANEIEELPF